MRLRFGLALAAAAALALGACGVPKNEVGSTSGGSVVGVDPILTGDKALYAATAAYTGAGIGIETAVKAGVLHGANATKVKGYYDAAYTALQAARVARSTGDALIESQQATSALALIGQATQLVPAATKAPAG